MGTRKLSPGNASAVTAIISILLAAGAAVPDAPWDGAPEPLPVLAEFGVSVG